MWNPDLLYSKKLKPVTSTTPVTIKWKIYFTNYRHNVTSDSLRDTNTYQTAFAEVLEELLYMYT